MKIIDKSGMLAVITLIGLMTFAGSAQAAVAVTGDVNSTVAEGEIVTLWLDVCPSDYVTVAVTDCTPRDYYWYSDLTFMLTRNGYSSGDTDIPVTIAMYCSGTQRDIDGVLHSSYNNVDKNVTVVHLTVNYADGIYMPSPMVMELEPCAAEETFSKTLYGGWNLISLPLTPSDSSVSAVLSGVSCDAVYRYNATSKQFESADVMEPGTGYFVHATAESTWTYSGAAYTSTSTGISLKQGLNMVGWLNCSKDVGDALSSISGDYYYVAQWNATAQKYEVHNPAAPDGFNDFPRMDRGTGYFISAKQDCILSESC